MPPTRGELEGDDAFRTLTTTGRRRLLADSFLRFRAADGFSHSRALAFQITLTLLPALIAVMGLAVDAGQEDFTRGARAGGIATLIAGASAIGQVERGANRIYGVERDRGLRGDLRADRRHDRRAAVDLLTAIALFLGLAFAAQLEAVRAGVPEPRLEEEELGARAESSRL